MTINSRTSVALTPGFIISMVGLSEFPFGLIMMFLIDKYVPMEPIFAGISVGQFVAAFLIIGGLGLFFYGRHMGWKPRGQTGSSGKGSNASNNPVKRM